MSATGRQRKDGLENTRATDDAYMTPRWVVRALLDELGSVLLPAPTTITTTTTTTSNVWHEPCVGLGAIPWEVADWCREKGIIAPKWVLTDIREPYAPTIVHAVESRIADFLTAPATQASVVVTNPPYLMAEEFARKARQESKHVVMLLRLNFLATKRRSDWLRSDMPDVYVLPQRPSFSRNAKGQVGTDASEYAWLHWHGQPRTEGRVKLLGLRPAA